MSYFFRYKGEISELKRNLDLKSPTHLINNIPFHIKIDVTKQVTVIPREKC